MIISDTHRFVFVHIPKCAGTFVRDSIKIFDEKTIPSGYGSHPLLGTIDYNHLPLSLLREYYRPEYEKVRDYYSFAIARDPFSRFPSSVKQRLSFHKKKRIMGMSKREIRKEMDDIIRIISFNQDITVLPAEYIHFQKQVSYIFDNDRQLIHKIYRMDQLPKLFEDLGKCAGVSVQPELSVKGSKLNKSSLIYRNNLIRHVEPGIRALGKVLQFLPKSTKQTLKSTVFKSHSDLDIFQSNYVTDFISDYYREDVELFQSLGGANKHKT